MMTLFVDSYALKQALTAKKGGGGLGGFASTMLSSWASIVHMLGRPADRETSRPGDQGTREPGNHEKNKYQKRIKKTF